MGYGSKSHTSTMRPKGMSSGKKGKGAKYTGAVYMGKKTKYIGAVS